MRIGIPLLVFPLLYLRRKDQLGFDSILDPDHWFITMLMPIALFGALIWSFLVYKPLAIEARKAPTFAEQLQGFRLAQIARFNWAALAAWGATLVYFLSNSPVGIVFFVVALFVSSVYRPSRQNIIKELKLGDVEEDIVWKDLDY